MMRNLSLVVAALMCGSAALAQTATDTAPAEAPATDAATAAEPTATDSTATTTATTSAAPMAASGSVDIAAHDANKDGVLSPLEFAMHAGTMGSGDAALTAEAKRERYSRASGNGAIKLLNATAADFSKADANRDKRVDPTELAAWHSGGTATASATTTTTAPASQPITSGAGTMSPAPSTSDTGATMDSSAAPTTGGGSSTSSDRPTDDMSDDMQNSTDPSESTTTPPTA